MGKVVRCSLPGYNAITETDKTKFSLRSDEDNVLLKEFARGAGDSGGSSVAVTHNLGYVPFYIDMGEVSAGRYKVISGFNFISGGGRSRTTTTELELTTGAFDTGLYKYFVFYDDMD